MPARKSAALELPPLAMLEAERARPASTPNRLSSFGSWLGKLAGNAKMHVLGVVVGVSLIATSAMLTPQQSLPPEVELANKAGALVTQQYNGDYHAAFDHYAHNDGEVSSDELSSFLSDAGIGNFATRGLWVQGVLERFDTNHDTQIDWPEFQQARAEVNAK